MENLRNAAVLPHLPSEQNPGLCCLVTWASREQSTLVMLSFSAGPQVLGRFIALQRV